MLVTPSAFDQGRRDVDAAAGDDAVLRVEVGGREADGAAALRATDDAALDAVRASEHPPREVHAAGGQQVADAARTDALAAQAHLRHFVGEEAEALADLAQKVDVALAVAPEAKPRPK